MLSWHRLLGAAAFVLALILGLDIGLAAEKGKKIPESDPFGRLTENRLPGAVRLNHKDITASVMPPDKDATLIFYCMNEL